MILRIGLLFLTLFLLKGNSIAAIYQPNNSFEIHQIALGLSWRHQQDIGVTFAKSKGDPQANIDAISARYQSKMRQLDSLKDAFYVNKTVLRFDNFFIQRELDFVTTRFTANLEKMDINTLSDYMNEYPYYQPQPLRYNEELIYLALITVYILDECTTSPEDYADQDLVWIDFLISNYRPLQVSR